MNILIVEDEMLIAEDVSEMLEELGHTTVGIADTWNKAIGMADKNDVDLALLDIRIKGDKDGIEVGLALKEMYGIHSVFLTSHSDKAIVSRAVKAEPLSYLIKPIKEEELFVALKVAEGQIKSLTNSNDLYLQIGNFKQKVKVSDISHLESDGNYTFINVGDEKMTSSKGLKKWLENVELKDFIRVHRTYAVNASMITEISSRYVKMGDIEIPISRGFKDNLEGLY